MAANAMYSRLLVVHAAAEQIGVDHLLSHTKRLLLRLLLLTAFALVLARLRGQLRVGSAVHGPYVGALRYLAVVELL